MIFHSITEMHREFENINTSHYDDDDGENSTDEIEIPETNIANIENNNGDIDINNNDN